jgi:diketogulonate reductase-like aldo/keto reductase
VTSPRCPTNTRRQGKIKYIGLSEASARTLRRASKIVHIDAVQLEYSPFALECEADDDRYGVLKACRELGTAIVAYSPLGEFKLEPDVSRVPGIIRMVRVRLADHLDVGRHRTRTLDWTVQVTG